jgi:hypothetical protein
MISMLLALALTSSLADAPVTITLVRWPYT